jgi:hypothetical protein
MTVIAEQIIPTEEEETLGIIKDETITTTTRDGVTEAEAVVVHHTDEDSRNAVNETHEKQYFYMNLSSFFLIFFYLNIFIGIFCVIYEKRIMLKYKFFKIINSKFVKKLVYTALIRSLSVVYLFYLYRTQYLI